jgi:molybdopterin synthase catalytic subunit
MRVRVRLFAVQRELAGTRAIDLDIGEGGTIEQAWAALVERFPVLAAGRGSLRFARNGDYAEPSERLADGDELACIPPVSGGDSVPRADDVPLTILEIREAPLGPAILDELATRLATPADGAVVGFLGRTRQSPGTPAPGQEDAAGRYAAETVHALEYEAHETMAIAQLERIASEVADRFGVRRLAIVHRTGTVPLGEASVAIVAVSPHRDAAFEAARYAIDETKARAPIWKAEHFASGAVWIGEVARTGPTDAAAPAEEGR